MDDDGVTVDFDPVAERQLFALLRFHHAIEFDEARTDQLLGFATRIGESAKFDELAELDRDFANDYFARAGRIMDTHVGGNLNHKDTEAQSSIHRDRKSPRNTLNTRK